MPTYVLLWILLTKRKPNNVSISVKKAKQNETDGSTEGGSGGGGLTTSATDTLKEMGDLNSGMASSIIQMYSAPIFNNFFATQSNIRAQALKVCCRIWHKSHCDNSFAVFE